MNKNKAINISITPGTIVMILFVLLGFWFAYILRDLILVVLTAVVFASAIEPATAWLVKKGFPRVVSVVIMYLTVVIIMSSFFYFFVPPLVNETTDFFKSLPTYLETLKLAPSDVSFASESVSIGDRLLQIQNILKASSSGVLNFANAVFGGVMSFVLIVVLSFYFAVQEDGLDNFLKFITPPKHHEYMLDLWRRAQVKIGRWLQGQILLSFIAGVMVYISLLILGVPYALLLALVAGVLELIPVFGSILAAIPAVMLAFIDSGMTLALLTIVAYIIVNQLQGNIIYPMVVQKVLGVPPLIIILSIIAGAQLAGFLGVLIAVPVSAAVQEWVSDIQKEKQELSNRPKNRTAI